jgi:hypothetical protein
MIINNAQVKLQAQHESVSVQQQTLNVQVWRENPAQATNQDRVDISTQALLSTESVSSQKLETLCKNIELEVSLLKQLVERLTGKKIEFVTIDQSADTSVDAVPLDRNNSTSQVDWGLAIDFTRTTHESESLNFEASALVNTADGKTIEVSLSLNYSSSFSQTESFSLKAGQALKDPLVLNFSGSSIELSSNRFEFDLDMDGELDQVPLLQSNSAYLAIDNNHDGLINNGMELFGAISGDGFSDLAKFDADGNQWIDSNDAVFSKLRLYQPGSNGEGQLISLTDKGVGALYLGNVATPFRLTEGHSQDLSGELRSSGLFLMESGEAGSMQQLDLVV